MTVDLIFGIFHALIINCQGSISRAHFARDTFKGICAPSVSRPFTVGAAIWFIFQTISSSGKENSNRSIRHAITSSAYKENAKNSLEEGNQKKADEGGMVSRLTYAQQCKFEPAVKLIISVSWDFFVTIPRESRLTYTTALHLKMSS